MAEGGRVKSEARHVGDGGISNTVEVRGFSKNTSSNVLEMYFENSRRSGGGDVEEVQIVDGVACITFKEAEVAQRVISHNHHQVDGQTLTVTLLHPSPPKSYYKNRVLIQGLNSAVAEELLKNFLETVTEAKIKEFLYGVEEGNVVVTLSDNIDIGQLRKTIQEKRVEGAVLKVSRVALSNCIIVQNLQASTSHDAILFYFENRRSGGGDVERVELKAEEGYCLVYFEDHSVIDRVLLKSHNVDGADVEVHLHHECLGQRSSRNKSDPYLRISSLGNKDSSTLEEEITDNQSSSVSSNPDKESDFVEVQEWQENDGKNCVLPLWIKYKRASEMVIKDIKKIPCSWTFHLYWNFYTKTKQGQQMLHEILNKYNCSVAVCTEDEDLFIFEISEKTFEQDSDVVHFIHTVLDNIHKSTQQFLHLDILLVEQRMQGYVLQLMKQRKELDGARIEVMGQQDNDAICVVCTEKDKMSVLHIVTEIIHNVRECFENHEEIISLDHNWQKVMKHFGYIQKLVEKYPKVTIILDETKPAIMLKDESDQSKADIILKGPRDQSKAAADHLMELVGIAQSEVKEDIFSPGCQFEIFTYPEMCDYIDTIIMEISIVWIPNQLTKKIHLFSKKLDKIKSIDKFIKGCVHERVYPLPKDQSAHSHERFMSLEKLKKKHTGKIVINPSSTGLLVTTADDIFERVDAAMKEIISKQTGSSVDPFPPLSSQEARPKTKAAPLSPPDQHEKPVVFEIIRPEVNPSFLTSCSDIGFPQHLMDTLKTKTEVNVIEKTGQFLSKGIIVKDLLSDKLLPLPDEQEQLKFEDSLFQDETKTADLKFPASSNEYLAIIHFIKKIPEPGIKQMKYQEGCIRVTCNGNMVTKLKEKISSLLSDIRSSHWDEIYLNQGEEITSELPQNDLVMVLYIKEERKVVLFSSSTEQLARVKHKIMLILGRTFFTRRRKRELGSLNTSVESDSSLFLSLDSKTIKESAGPSKNTFLTENGVIIKVYSMSITETNVDCIVNATDTQLRNSSGVSRAIANAAGKGFKAACDEHLSLHGPLKRDEAVVLLPGSLKCRCIISIAGPAKIRRDEIFVDLSDLENIIVKSLKVADGRCLKSVAFPSVCAGLAGFDAELCAHLYYRAVNRFIQQTKSPLNLKEIHFVDIDTSMTQIIQAIFTKHFSPQTVDVLSNPIKASQSFPASVLPLEEDAVGHTKSSSIPTAETNTDGMMSSEKRIKGGDGMFYYPHEKTIIKLVTDDISDIETDALVSIEDANGSGNGRIAKALLTAAGSRYQDVEHSKVKMARRSITEVVVTGPGRLKCEFVLHAIAPEWGFETTRETQTFKNNVAITMMNIMDAAFEKKVKCIAVPLVGIFTDETSQVPLIICCEAMIAGLNIWIQSHSQEYQFKEVILICCNSLAFKCFANVLSANRKEDIKGGISQRGIPFKSSELQSKSDVSITSSLNIQSKENCVICMEFITDPKILPKCGHTFCKECIDQQFMYKPVCPCCGVVYGKITGIQPEGTMKIFYKKDYLPGFEACGTIVIFYEFNGGTQKAEHPKPGRPYNGTKRKAYLPNNDRGKLVLNLLREAFKRRLVFTIGTSRTTGLEDTVTWNDIHHKTNRDGGPKKFGYPDATYLDRVIEELAVKGVTEESLLWM